MKKIKEIHIDKLKTGQLINLYCEDSSLYATGYFVRGNEDEGSENCVEHLEFRNSEGELNGWTRDSSVPKNYKARSTNKYNYATDNLTYELVKEANKISDTFKKYSLLYSLKK